MFKIYDGREKFYQWDLDRKLIVEDASVTEVHFCNRTDSCSLVCETYVEDGLTLANVPNVLLTTDWKIHVYAYDGKHTKHEACYEVVSRTKPSDYIYTETEVKRYEDYENRIKATEDTLVEVDKAFKEVAEVFGSIDEELGGLRTDIDTLEKTVEDIGNADLSGKPGKFYTATGEIYNDYELNMAIGDYSHVEGLGVQAQDYSVTILGTVYSISTLGLTIASIDSNKTTLTTSTVKKIITQDALESLFSKVAAGFVLELEGGIYIPVKSYKINGSITSGFYLTLTLYSAYAGADIKGKAINDVRLGVAFGEAAHVEGKGNLAVGNYSHAEGILNSAEGFASHVEGRYNIASGEYSHAEGLYTKATNTHAHAEGHSTTASGINAHSEGKGTVASADYAHAEGFGSNATGNCSHAEGAHCDATGYYSHAQGWDTTASGTHSHAEGYGTISDGDSSHAEGKSTQATANYSHAEGFESTATAISAHAEGSQCHATANYTHAEGFGSTATAQYAHAEGFGADATAESAHAEGRNTTASGIASHAEGSSTASGGYSHAENFGCSAAGDHSHAEGISTIVPAGSTAQHVQGKYNAPLNNNYAHVVGGGSGTADSQRKNIHTLTWGGNAWYAGTVEGTALILKSPSGKRFQITVSDTGTLSTTAL